MRRLVGILAVVLLVVVGALAAALLTRSEPTGTELTTRSRTTQAGLVYQCEASPTYERCTATITTPGVLSTP